MVTIVGIPGVTGIAPEIPESLVSPALIIANGHTKKNFKKNRTQRRQEFYLRRSRRNLPAKQRQ